MLSKSLAFSTQTLVSAQKSSSHTYYLYRLGFVVFPDTASSALVFKCKFLTLGNPIKNNHKAPNEGIL